MRSQKAKAQDFRGLHHGKRVLILPNAWDVPSARVFENEGFPAIATSSAGLMVSLGYPDGEVIDRDEFVSAVRRIGRVLSIPLSVDIVAGFGRTTKEVLITVKAILKAGGVGINIEDFAHATKKLYPIERQIENVKAIRKLGGTLDIPLVINARTDALRFGQGDDEAKFQEAVRRASAYRDAGADCIYPMGLTEADPRQALCERARLSCQCNGTERSAFRQRPGKARGRAGKLWTKCFLRSDGSLETSRQRGVRERNLSEPH